MATAANEGAKVGSELRQSLDDIKIIYKNCKF